MLAALTLAMFVAVAPAKSEAASLSGLSKSAVFNVKEYWYDYVQASSHPGGSSACITKIEYTVEYFGPVPVITGIRTIGTNHYYSCPLSNSQ